jgi:hypothetical protein
MGRVDRLSCYAPFKTRRRALTETASGVVVCHARQTNAWKLVNECSHSLASTVFRDTGPGSMNPLGYTVAFPCFRSNAQLHFGHWNTLRGRSPETGLVVHFSMSADPPHLPQVIVIQHIAFSFRFRPQDK